MSRTAEIVAPFGAEERVFRLTLAGMEALQTASGHGPAKTLERLWPFVAASEAKMTLRAMMENRMMGDWTVTEVRTTILQGLIGGGMSATEAGILVRAEYDPRMLAPRWVLLAFKILAEAMTNPEEEPAGEPKAAPKTRRRRRGASTSAA